ncbi:hypothetical protein CAPTEDRAFT_191853 [Capitella teleta]|uniref:Uncharacterized protein n=1 Tax=Capitella teleta TaxID=283909 RepID=R7TYX2_CAPTE|nr:hypothetical protein CAPTEDRAFT_191853 [Capitella teleta]|eukprot:ELT98797.1 hypothetical protein CAPTEDRAFT_191853 [Capitella teleta]
MNIAGLLFLLGALHWSTVAAQTYGEECGANPMLKAVLVARRAGRPLRQVLEVLRRIDPPAFKELAQKFRQYAACVALVDTGYFRKRSQASPVTRSNILVTTKTPSPSVNLGFLRKFQMKLRAWLQTKAVSKWPSIIN